MSAQSRSWFAQAGWLIALTCSCGSCGGGAAAPANEPAANSRPDAPIVAAEPGAWFDGQGNLTVVGAGRRLRLVLSAPIVACSPAFQGSGTPRELAEKAGLPFREVGEACRQDHPSVLLAEESLGASRRELELNYHEVARCAAQDLGATSGWIPELVAASDPCPIALGLGWRLPKVAELQGLTVDDRKAIAGALFDTDDRADFGSLLLYAHGEGDALTLVTLSPNASEQAPSLGEERRRKPFFGAALRCLLEPSTQTPRPAAPPLPHAAGCLRQLRAEQAALKVAPTTPALPELRKLMAWLDMIRRTPTLAQSESTLKDLAELLAAPALEQLAREAREERSLTEHYAELAEGLDDASVSEGERARRRAEFDSLRKRLGGKIVQSAVTSSSERTQLAALLSHLMSLLENSAEHAKSRRKSAKSRPDYHALLSRIRELQAGPATKP